ncbi:MAG: GNAT family N-acetyltransferase [Clostridia bacterium]|nr:GNAT family N-acetyltransferase [Clostridia bacterium]
MWFRKIKAEYSDGVIDLVPLRLYPPEREMGFGRNYDFMITEHDRRYEIGRISLRVGESPCVYYFGHIGYHIDPPYRGHHYARRACELLRPLITLHGKESVVITCDPDNWPSRKTCVGLGCVLERIVDVPEEIQYRWEISAVKCRYIWRMNGRMDID